MIEVRTKRSDYDPEIVKMADEHQYHAPIPKSPIDNWVCALCDLKGTLLIMDALEKLNQ